MSYVFLKVEVVAAVVLAVVLGSVQINKLKCYYSITLPVS